MKLPRLPLPKAPKLPEVDLDDARHQVADVAFSALFGGQRAKAYRDLVRALEILPAHAVLDVGCGTGLFCRVLRETTGPGSVIGVDNDASAIEYARRKSAKNSDIVYRAGEADSLPVGDASVDVVTYLLSFHHVPEERRDAALAEARRVLRPGGRLAIIDLSKPEDVADAVTFGWHPCVRIADPLDTLVDRVGRAGFRTIESRTYRSWLGILRATA